MTKRRWLEQTLVDLRDVVKPMAWFDDPAQFYLDDIEAEMPLSQGDIVIAPLATFRLGIGEKNVAGPRDLNEARIVSIWQASLDEWPAAPSIQSEVRWGLAMVLPHSCALDKEWNERVTALTSEGATQLQAEDTATADPLLDQFVTVSPLVLYDDSNARLSSNIAIGNRLGSFPVCADTSIPRTYVDFNQITTLHYSLLPTRRRIRALTEKAVAHLGARLAQHFAFRSLSGLREIEKALGQKIEQVTTTPGARKTTINFVLEDGTSLVFEGPHRDTNNEPAPQRPARK